MQHDISITDLQVTRTSTEYVQITLLSFTQLNQKQDDNYAE